MNCETVSEFAAAIFLLYSSSYFLGDILASPNEMPHPTIHFEIHLIFDILWRGNNGRVENYLISHPVQNCLSYMKMK